MFEKVWDDHVVVPETADTPAVLFIDLHLTHEVTTPQAYTELRTRGLKLRRPDLTLATMDHSTPTRTEQVFGGVPIAVDSAAKQVQQLEINAQRIRRRAVQSAGQPPRHRAHHRARARHHAARQDDRLRRLPHLDAWRFRRPRLRHRHDGSRSRAGDAVPAAAPAEDLRDQRHQRAADGRHREGPDPRHHRQDRRLGRHGLRARVSRPRHRSRCRWTSA